MKLWRQQVDEDAKEALSNYPHEGKEEAIDGNKFGKERNKVAITDNMVENDDSDDKIGSKNGKEAQLPRIKLGKK